MANMVNARKTHCGQGHEFTPENTLRTPQGHRFCRACRNARSNARSKALHQRIREAREKVAAKRILGLPEKFWAQAQFRDQGYVTPCLVWTGTKSKAGYGVFTIERRQHRVHRLAHEAVNGPIPVNPETGKPFPLDHICHNDNPTCAGGETCPHRGCINPSHTEAVTAAVNVMRGMSFAPANAAKTHCKRGHEFTAENTGAADGKGRRFCRECRRLSGIRSNAKQTAARRAERAQNPPVKSSRELMPCGTAAAYLRHLRKGEPTDDACRKAHAEAARKGRAVRAATMRKAAA